MQVTSDKSLNAKIPHCLISVGHIVWCFALLQKKSLVLVKLDYFERHILRV